MLAIRLQRTGRKGHAQFRVIVQEAQLSPKSGKVVANLGPYDPHTKVAVLDKEKAEFYLSNGAQPSDRVAKLFAAEKIKLPAWVNVLDNQSRTTRNPEKLRKNRPAEEAATPAEASDEAAPADETAANEPADEPATEEEPAKESKDGESAEADEEAAKDEPETEKPAEEPKEEAAKEA